MFSFSFYLMLVLHYHLLDILVALSEHGQGSRKCRATCDDEGCLYDVGDRMMRGVCMMLGDRMTTGVWLTR